MKKIIILLFIIYFSFTTIAYGYEESILDITKMDITSIQNSIDKGYMTYEKLIKLYLDRIEEYENKYNALISINENIIEEAIECDNKYNENGRDSILFCIPIIIKDNIDCKGFPTTGGTKALKDSYPKENSEIVENLIKSGALILGKANLSEFAFSARDSKSSYGSVKNAYNIDYTPLGSSGGSAVSVAASYSPISIGTDTNSSIRLPASASNLVGLRPTQGLLSNRGIIAYDITRDTAGPISKNVKDNAILFTSLANNGIDYTKYLNKNGLSNKKIGVIEDFIIGANSEVKKLFDDSIKKIKEKGAEIIYIKNFYTDTVKNYNSSTIYGRTMAYQFNQYILNTSSKIKSFDQLVNNGGYIQALSGYNIYGNENLLLTIDYKEKEILKNKYKEYVLNVLKEKEVDVLVYPSIISKIIKINEAPSKSMINNSYKIAPATGFPAITIPMGFDSNGLPYGFEILSKPNNENILYEIGYAYEQIDYNFTNPDNVSPNLYLKGDNTKLMILYEKNIGINNELDNEAKSYFINYKNDDINEQIKLELINKYLKLEKNLNENNQLKENKVITGKIIQITLVSIVVLLSFGLVLMNLKYLKKKH